MLSAPLVVNLAKSPRGRVARIWRRRRNALGRFLWRSRGAVAPQIPRARLRVWAFTHVVNLHLENRRFSRVDTRPRALAPRLLVGPWTSPRRPRRVSRRRRRRRRGASRLAVGTLARVWVFHSKKSARARDVGSTAPSQVSRWTGGRSGPRIHYACSPSVSKTLANSRPASLAAAPYSDNEYLSAGF